MGAAVGDGDVAVGAQDVLVERPGVDGVGEDGFKTFVQGEVQEGVDRVLALGGGNLGYGATVVLVVTLGAWSPGR